VKATSAVSKFGWLCSDRIIWFCWFWICCSWSLQKQREFKENDKKPFNISSKSEELCYCVYLGGAVLLKTLTSVSRRSGSWIINSKIISDFRLTLEKGGFLAGGLNRYSMNLPLFSWDPLKLVWKNDSTKISNKFILFFS